MYAYKAMEEFKDLEDKHPFLEPTIQFLKQEKEDQVRSWGTSVLELIGGKEAYESLDQMLKKEKTMDEKRKYKHTRFFALKAIANRSLR
jgi:hypothetical protein